MALSSFHVDTLACSILVLLLLPLPACSGGGEESEVPAQESQEEQQERDRKARSLLQQGMRAPVSQKLLIYAGLIARYPDTPSAPKAYFLLVRNQLERDVGDYQGALERTTAFASRHPDLPDWSECFTWLYRGGRNKKLGNEYMAAVVKAWGAALDNSLDGGRVKQDAELLLRLHKARLTLYEGDKARALERFQEAVRLLPIENKRWEMDTLIETATLQAEFPEHQAAARATFERAIKLCETHTSQYTKADLRGHMKTLGLEAKKDG